VHRFRKLLVIPAALLLVGIFVVPWFFRKSDERSLPPPKSGVATLCPRLIPHNLTAGMARVATETQNLGGGVFGKSTIYSDGAIFSDVAREVSFHIGYEVIEKLEDLDFQQRPGRIGSREVTLYEAKSLPPGSIVGATWETDIGHPECSLVTVVSKKFSRAEFEQVVAGVEVRPG
jgi:hypothetical protein